MFMFVFLQNTVLTLFWLDYSYSEQKPCQNKGKMAGRYQFDTHLTADWNRVKEKAV